VKQLIALTPILYGNRQYEPGEALPTSDSSYAEAWERSGSAVWKNPDDGAGEETTETKKPAAKARRKTAKAGAEGIAQPATGAEADLVGVVPSPKARGVVKEPSKRAPKSQA
jgi:hypothetical protein